MIMILPEENVIEFAREAARMWLVAVMQTCATAAAIVPAFSAFARTKLHAGPSTLTAPSKSGSDCARRNLGDSLVDGVQDATKHSRSTAVDFACCFAACDVAYCMSANAAKQPWFSKTVSGHF